MKVETFTMGGHEVRAVIRELDGEVEVGLDNVLSQSAIAQGNYRPGDAKGIVLIRGLKKLTVDEKEYKIGSAKRLPRIFDPETKKSLMTVLLEKIVALPGNEFLLWEEDYADVFSRYAPEETDEDEEAEEMLEGSPSINPT